MKNYAIKMTNLGHGLDGFLVTSEFHISLARCSAIILENDSNVDGGNGSEKLEGKKLIRFIIYIYVLYIFLHIFSVLNVSLIP